MIRNPNEKVSIYDPSINAFREVTIDIARKFVAESIKVAKKIKDIDNEE